MMRKARFYIETFGEGRSFEGYTDGTLWNGWACPWFDFETAKSIVDITSAFYDAHYDTEKDEFVFDMSQDGDPEAIERIGPVEVEGVGKLYPIGTESWIWEELNQP